MTDVPTSMDDPDLYPVGYRFNLVIDRGVIERAVFGPFTIVDHKQGLDRDGLPAGQVDYVVENARGGRSVMAHGFIRDVGRPIKEENPGDE